MISRGMKLSDNPIKTSDLCSRKIHTHTDTHTIFIINFKRFMGLFHSIQSLLNQALWTLQPSGAGGRRLGEVQFCLV